MTADLGNQWFVALAFGVAGLAFGWAYFAILQETVDRFAEGRGWRAAGLTLARVGAAALFFGIAAKIGACPLLVAFICFIAMRMLALRAVQRTA